MYKYGNEPWGCIKENFCRLLERLKFLRHGIIVKTLCTSTLCQSKKMLDRSRTSLFAAHFKLNSSFLVHCDDILRGKDTLQKFSYSLVMAFGTALGIKLYELTQFLHFVIRHMEAFFKQAHKCTIDPHISHFFGDHTVPRTVQ
jgi:hypothetical protein